MVNSGSIGHSDEIIGVKDLEQGLALCSSVIVTTAESWITESRILGSRAWETSKA
jgi:hypothetical protein